VKLAVLPAPLVGIPWRVLIPLTLLVCFGSAVLYSAAGGSLQPFAASHLMRFGVFVVMALVIRRFPRDLVMFAAYPAYAAVLLMLVVVDAIGAVGGGAQRWIDLGFMQLQPSEFMKPTIVLVLATFYNSLPPAMTASWRALIPAGLLIGVPVGLVMLQPDLGTALAITFGGVVVMFLAGLPIKWFAGGALAGAVVAPLAYFFALHDYQRNRVLTFLDPESDPLGTGYHITQSKIAIGSGGLTGKGFGEGSQSHLNYLPEPHTDFVFATMAEEWGLLGGLLVLLVFGIILRWGLTVARRAPDRFSQLLAGGMTATIFFYVAINLLMVMGLAPVVGIPLPFMSHGGSSMMTNMICLGTLMMIDRWSRRAGHSSTLS
jgi:rod shape determining protein RodA